MGSEQKLSYTQIKLDDTYTINIYKVSDGYVWDLQKGVGVIMRDKINAKAKSRVPKAKVIRAIEYRILGEKIKLEQLERLLDKEKCLSTVIRGIK